MQARHWWSIAFGLTLAPPMAFVAASLGGLTLGCSLSLAPGGLCLLVRDWPGPPSPPPRNGAAAGPGSAPGGKEKSGPAAGRGRSSSGCASLRPWL